MVGPGGGVAGTYLQYVSDHDHIVDCAVWVASDVLDKTEGANVEDALSR